MKLGVFDSGLGGLTVVRAIRRLYPHVDIVYLGDTARVPYGVRSPQVIVQYAIECAHFLSTQKIDAVVIACNTVSALAIPEVKQQMTVPVYGVLEPGARAASKYDRVGVLATRATVRSQAYTRAIHALNPKSEVVSVASPLLVPLVEEGWAKSPNGKLTSIVSQTLSHYLEPLAHAKIQAMILGCTHYPLLKELIEAEFEKLGWTIPLIDSGEELAKEIPISNLENPDHTGKLEVYTTDESVTFQSMAEAFLSESVPHVARAKL